MSATVKSAARVLEVFEYFAERHRPASVMELAKALGYPQSSTSVLLRSLVGLGYFDHDPHARTFVPNGRMAILTNWIQARAFGDSGLVERLEALHRATGETVILGLQNGMRVQYVYVLEADTPVRFHLRIGTMRPLHRAALGLLLLSLKPDAEVRALLRRFNAEMPPDADPRDRADVPAVMSAVEDARHTGFVFSQGLQTTDAGVIARLVPLPPGGAPLAVGVGGPLERLRRQEGAIHAALDSILGPIPARATPRTISDNKPGPRAQEEGESHVRQA